MASSELELKLTWENNVSFKMESKAEGEDWITVIETAENQHLADVWDNHVTGICRNFFDMKMAQIGSEMKS